MRRVLSPAALRSHLRRRDQRLGDLPQPVRNNPTPRTPPHTQPNEPTPHRTRSKWAIPVRDELTVRFSELTLATAESLLESGDHTAAIAACRRLLAYDPFVEPAYEVVAAARLAVGDSAGAHRAFRECERLFEEELDIRPTWTLNSSGVHALRHVR
ncbi:bacterial transcriptional activator domain-containing protein [Streptomyces sp. NPDC004980]